jgi:hypothetical protein
MQDRCGRLTLFSAVLPVDLFMGQTREKVSPLALNLFRCRQAAVNFWYVKALDMFGRSQSKRSERYVYWGLKRRTNAEAREQFMQEVNPLIEQMGLAVPDPNKGRLYL